MREAGPLDQLIRAFAGLPGLGPRSARRIALHLLTSRDTALLPLIAALEKTAESVKICPVCGNLDTVEPCRVCRADGRNRGVLCVVATVADLWAIERTGAYKGLYHCLGGVLSALDGITPDRLNVDSLLSRVVQGQIEEVILALSATVDGQTTVHYLTDRLHEQPAQIKISRLAHGVPVGGELDYLDDGTIATALKSRASL
jgi:recombination protein RecR